MPILTILAGSNGAGKTNLSEFLFKQNLLSERPFNIDLIDDNDIYNQLSGNPNLIVFIFLTMFKPEIKKGLDIF